MILDCSNNTGTMVNHKADEYFMSPISIDYYN